MCLALLLPGKKQIPEEHLRAGFDRNRDGAGFAYCKNNQIVIKKGYFKYEDFYKDFLKARNENLDSPFLIHFRIATCGPVNAENCHPWAIGKEFALIHNGTFQELKTNCEKISDTGLFAESLAKILIKSPHVHNSKWFKWLFGYGTQWNKFVVLRGDGSYTIYNVKSWRLINDIYYSNESYKPIKRDTTKYLPAYRCNGRNREKRKFHPKYRMKGNRNFLSIQEINHLTHTRKKKIKELVLLGEVEAIFEENAPDPRSAEYKNYWLQRSSCYNVGEYYPSGNKKGKTFQVIKKDLKKLHGIDWD